jgi:hypothetical protein
MPIGSIYEVTMKQTAKSGPKNIGLAILRLRIKQRNLRTRDLARMIGRNPPPCYKSTDRQRSLLANSPRCQHGPPGENLYASGASPQIPPPIIPMLTKLRIALNAAREMCREAEIIDSKEASANRLISQASEYGLESAMAQRRIADARMILDLCASRRRFLKKALPESLGALLGEYKSCVKAWSELLLPKIESIRQEALAALRPFYDGQKRHLENDFAALRVPAVFRAEEALSLIILQRHLRRCASPLQRRCLTLSSPIIAINSRIRHQPGRLLFQAG